MKKFNKSNKALCSQFDDIQWIEESAFRQNNYEFFLMKLWKIKKIRLSPF